MLNDQCAYIPEGRKSCFQLYLIDGLITCGKITEASRILSGLLDNIKQQSLGAKPLSNEITQDIWLKSLFLLKRIGQYDLLGEGIVIALDKLTSNNNQSQLFTLLTDWIESVTEENFLSYYQKYGFIEKEEIYSLYKSPLPMSKDIFLSVVYYHQKKYAENQVWKRTLAEYMSEYYLRKAGYHEVANGFFKRNPQKVYFPQKEDSLPHFLYAYARILSTTGTYCDAWDKTPFYEKLFTLFHDELPGAYSFQDKLLSAAHVMLKEKKSDTKTLLKVLAMRLEAQGGFSDTPADEWYVFPYENLIQWAKNLGRMDEAVMYSLQVGDRFRKIRKDQLLTSIFSEGTEKEKQSRGPVKKIYTAAIEINEELAQEIKGSKHRSGFYREMMTKAHDKMIQFFFEVNEPAEALFHAESAKARTLLDLRRKKIKSQILGEKIELKVVEAKAGKRGVAGIKTVSPPSPLVNKTNIIEHMQNVIKKIQNAFLVLSHESNQNNNQDNPILGLQDIQQRLNKEIVLEYYLGHDHAYAFLITKNMIDAKRLLTSTNKITTLVSKIRENIRCQQPFFSISPWCGPEQIR